MKLQRYKGNPILSLNPENWWESVATFNPGAIFKNGKALKLYYFSLIMSSIEIFKATAIFAIA